MKKRSPLTEILDDDPAYCLFGAETLLNRVGELEKQVAGAKNSDDIEYIHRLRVASRRARTTLNVFTECLPPKQVRNWKKTIRKITISCGAARDTDVLIAFLENYSTHLDARASRGLQYLIAMQKARRTVIQSDVVKVLDSLEASGILTDIKHTCETIRKTEQPRNSSTYTMLTYAKAREHITTKLEALLALGSFVHEESAITKHHKLRIAAKKLRYTMEVFSSIYRKGLNDQITLIKKFQDVLGEMHDYNVWVQDLTSHKRQIPPEAKYGLNQLLAHLDELRKARYGTFAHLWDDTVANHDFAKITDQIDTEPSSDIVRELLSRERKVGLISDIHGNIDALKAVVQDARRSGLDLFLNAGDAVGFGIYPTQVIQALRSPVFLNVLGNVDLETLEKLHSKPSGTDELEIGDISSSSVAYIQSLPKELRFDIAGRRILVTHGSPDSIEEHIYPNTPERRLREIASKTPEDVIVTGHTHLQMERNVDGVLFVNPGSVGRPVDGDSRAEYAVLSIDPLKVEFKRVNYDVETLADEMRKRGLSESHARMLLQAIPLESVKRQDNALANKRLWEHPSTVRRVKRVASNILSDQLHAEQDRRLALMVFDQTKELHSLGAEERYWLECAAILHDVGMSKGRKGHQKQSLKIILNNADLPFTEKERYIIGSIARYHRKALPDDSHYNLAPLTAAERKKVATLSSILRVANALDCSHQSIVRKVNVRGFPNHVILECSASGRNDSENQAIRKEKELFESVFNRDLLVVWKAQEAIQEPHLPSVTASVHRRPVESTA